MAYSSMQAWPLERMKRSRPGQFGIAGIVPQITVPQHKGQRRQRHGRAGMSAVGLLHRIHGQGANGVDAEQFQWLLGERVLHAGLACGLFFFFVTNGSVCLTTHLLPPFWWLHLRVLVVRFRPHNHCLAIDYRAASKK